MREVNRRTFLVHTGRWLALATLAPALSGCSRLLRWSESQGRYVEEEPGATAATGESSTSTSANVAVTGPGTSSSTAVSGTTVTLSRSRSNSARYRGHQGR